jgi:hypothetical protein
MVRPERFELPAFWFVARRSIQLSYGRTFREVRTLTTIPISEPFRNVGDLQLGTANRTQDRRQKDSRSYFVAAGAATADSGGS